MATATTAKMTVAPQNTRRRHGRRTSPTTPRRSAFHCRRPNLAPHDDDHEAMLARARRVAGWTPMIVFARCHALMGALVRRTGVFCAGRICPRRPLLVTVEPLAPPDATGNSDIDRPKTTKGRHMGRELVAVSRPAVQLARRSANGGIVEGFQGPQPRPLFLPEGRHPRRTKEAIAFSHLRAAFAKAGPEFVSRRIRCRHRINSKPSTSSKSRLPPTRPRRCWKLMALGVRNRCNGSKYMGVIRKTFLIDWNGRIVRIWPKVT